MQSPPESTARPPFRPSSCARCGASLPAESAAGPFCALCEAAPGPVGVMPVEPILLTGALAAITPFFFSVSEQDARTLGGEAGTADYVAIVAGLAAAVCGLLAFMAARRLPTDGKAKALLGGATILVAGLYDLAIGFGFL